MSSRSVSSLFAIAALMAAAPSAAGAAEPRPLVEIAARAELDAAAWNGAPPAWRPLEQLYAGREVTLAEANPAILRAGAATALARRSEGRSAKPKKALLLSLLLPGAGELYSGARGRATAFFITEGAIWAHYAGWEIAGHLRKDNYIEQAQINAGVGTGAGDDEYWRLVGAYERSSGSGPESYEEALRREARDQFPTDPAAQDAFVAERLPTGERAWVWSSDELRASYRATREDANRAFNRAELSIAFAILNRIASAIDTQVLHARDKRDADSWDGEGGVHILAGMTRDGGGRISLHSRF